MEATKKAPDVAGLEVLDTCVTLGRTVGACPPPWLGPDNILDVMDKYDIAEALVHSSEARMIRPRWPGNERLLREIEGTDRLHPVWALEPSERPGSSDARKMVEDMLAAGVRVARLMMAYAPPLQWLWGELCDVLQQHSVPCLLDFAKGGRTNCVPDSMTTDKLRELCLAYPRLPMILSHVSGGLGISQPTIPLMHRAPNLLIDTTGVTDYWRRVARTLGPERVVFASGMPFYEPSIFIGNVQYEHTLDAAAKKLICGDNIRRLMEGVR